MTAIQQLPPICWQGDYTWTKISGLKTLPLEITGDLLFSGDQCKNVRHLTKFSTQTVKGNVDARKLNLKTLEGIGRHCFTQINGILIIRASIQSNILGLMKIKNLLKVEVHTRQWSDMDDQISGNLKEAVRIINSHLASEERCIMSCKQDLMAAGLKDLAKL